MRLPNFRETACFVLGAACALFLIEGLYGFDELKLVPRLLLPLGLGLNLAGVWLEERTKGPAGSRPGAGQ